MHAIRQIQGLHPALQKCPFCGSEPEWVEVPGNDFIMRCISCHAATRHARWSPEEAAADWNARDVADSHLFITEDVPIDEYLAGEIRDVRFREYSNFESYPPVDNGFLCSDMVVVTDNIALNVEPAGEVLLYEEVYLYGSGYYEKALADDEEPVCFIRSEQEDGLLRSLVFTCGGKEYVVRANQKEQCMEVRIREV